MSEQNSESVREKSKHFQQSIKHEYYIILCQFIAEAVPIFVYRPFNKSVIKK